MLITLALAASCGDARLSPEEFQTRADSICADANRRVRGLAPVPREFGPELNRDVRELRSTLGTALEDLRDLDPPEDAAGPLRRMLSRLAKAHATLVQVVRAARARDERMFLAAEGQYITELAAAGRVARELGLRECQRLGFP